MFKIFLDDFRIPLDAFYYTQKRIFTEKDWTIVRNYDEFVKFIQSVNFNDITLISFDHDLADEHYDVEFRGYDEYTEKTGYDCAKWLVDYCMDNGYKLPEYYVHSMNPAGADNIIGYLENAKKHLKI